MTTPHEQHLVQYLLGGMQDEERIRFEDEYFADDHLLERLEAAETDLVDAYVRGLLSPEHRSAFEQRYLTDPAQAARVDAARRLLATAPGTSSVVVARKPQIRQVAALAAAVVVLAGAYIVVRQMDWAADTVPSSPPVSPSASPDTSSAVAPPPVEFTRVEFTLTGGVTRSADVQPPLVIPDRSNTVHLLTPVPLPVIAREYSAVITTPEGTTVHATDDVTSEGAASMLRTVVPAWQLAPGDYILTISSRGAGTSQVLAEYSFRVVLR